MSIENWIQILENNFIKSHPLLSDPQRELDYRYAYTHGLIKGYSIGHETGDKERLTKIKKALGLE